jgi:hypothetical protein
MSDDALRATRNTFDGLVLTESDLIGGDKIARQFAGLREDLAALSDDEPWLKVWLGHETTKGGMLFTAAKNNRTKNGSLDAPASDPTSRTAIIRSFNAWTREVIAHIDEYRNSPRTQDVVQPWQDAAQAFSADAMRVDG